jgi:hypothetical protein
LDDKILLDHGRYRGLWLIVLKRKTLERVHSAYYDLFKNPVYTTKSASSSTPFLNYNLDGTTFTATLGSSTTSSDFKYEK